MTQFPGGYNIYHKKKKKKKKKWIYHLPLANMAITSAICSIWYQSNEGNNTSPQKQNGNNIYQESLGNNISLNLLAMKVGFNLNLRAITSALKILG